jgi:hypothetical protein
MIDYVALFLWLDEFDNYDTQTEIECRLVLKKRAVRGTRHVMTLNFLRMTTRPGKVFKYVVWPSGNASCRDTELPENDGETGESIQVCRMDRSSEK